MRELGSTSLKMRSVFGLGFLILIALAWGLCCPSLSWAQLPPPRDPNVKSPLDSRAPERSASEAFQEPSPSAGTEVESTSGHDTPDATEVARALPTEPQGIAQLLVSRDCEYYGMRAYRGEFYVACGSDGLWVLSPDDGKTPSTSLVFLGQGYYLLSKRRHYGASVVGLVEQDGRLIGQVRHLMIMGGAAPTDKKAVSDFAPPAPTEQEKVVEEARIGEVIAVDDLRFRVDLGRRDGVGAGGRILFPGQPAVVGRVLSVQDESCWVRLGMGERLPKVGDKAQRTSRDPTRKLAFLENSKYRASLKLGAVIGSMVDAKEVMGLGLLEAALHIGALRLGVSTGPIGGGDGIFAYQVTGHVGLRHTVMGFDLSFGGMKINSQFDVPPARGIAFGPGLRLGPEDGIHVQGRMLLAIVYDEMLVGEVRAQVQVPVYQGVWMLARGSGGKAGVSSFDVGPRFLLDGNGGPGSWFLHLFGGPLFIYDSSFASGTGFHEQAGPAVGFSWEMRL